MTTSSIRPSGISYASIWALAQTAEERELVVAGPRAERDAVDAEAGDRQAVHEADRDVGAADHHALGLDVPAEQWDIERRHVPHSAPREVSGREQRGDDCQTGGDEVEDLVHVLGREVFLQQHLDAVRG
ncbi:MAG: hypothetical protein QM783_04910 [Phycisphaerales bacterium]